MHRVPINAHPYSEHSSPYPVAPDFGELNSVYLRLVDIEGRLQAVTAEGARALERRYGPEPEATGSGMNVLACAPGEWHAVLSALDRLDSAVGRLSGVVGRLGVL
jgi:hypothetical protein